MLKIKNISKTYQTGTLKQCALNDVSLDLRDNEFVAILGPSGSGKTTLLNIIGGLDKYDSGDLIINGQSTKNYKDRDFDNYRNHSVGFVFQSYNLIPHQSILSNVELALTIAGISKKERRQKAYQALEEVGLKQQAHKKPNQLSGGQMQRVAIARALINNPSILLADEPTGALDSKTSLQVMELLKKVADKHLVVMVTHNPELANAYANRIIKLQDGQIIADSNPYCCSQENQSIEKQNKRKAHMNFFTALSLSFNNLLTKKSRTILTAFAGSIGIIGIALILALSTGVSNYIDKIQEDTLSSYPLTINSESADATSAILSMVSEANNTKQEGTTIVEQPYLTTMFSSVGINDLKSFKEYLEEHQEEVDSFCNDIEYSYSISPQIYTIDAADNLARINPSSALSSFYSSSMSSLISAASSTSGIFTQMNDNQEELENDYDLLAGSWPKESNEMLIILSEPNKISDLLLYSLGLKDTKELKTMITDLMSGEEVENNGEALVLDYQDLLNLDLRLINSADTYRYNEKYQIWEDMSSDDEYMHNLYENATKLKISGIICKKEGSSSTSTSFGVVYQKELIDQIINYAKNSEIVKQQLENPAKDVISNKDFDQIEDDQESELDFSEMISIDEDALSKAFSFENSSSELAGSILNKSKAISQEIETLSNEAFKQICEQYALAIKMLIEGYNDAFGFVIPTKAPLGYVNNNPFEGCISDGSSDYKEMNTMSLDLNETKTIYVYQDNYLAYSIYNDILINLYKQNALNVDLLQSELLVEIASNCFDEYASQAKNKATSLIGISLIGLVDKKELETIDLDTIISNELAKTENIAQIKYQVSDLMSEISQGLIAKGLGESMASSLSGLSLDADQFAQAFKVNMDEEEISRIMNTMMSSTEEKSYSNNLLNFGYQDKDDPTSISFYFPSFDSKEKFLDFLDIYNEKYPDNKIDYTDITGLLMSSVKTIVDSVSYVLIAFVSISLIVSSIMIAVITLISVLERTKEIGILRAMGASKKNVSSIFNAETFIIGLLSGLLGIGTSYAFIPIINNIVYKLTNNPDIKAYLQPKAALILILIAVFLTIFAGFIPSRKAAKQDPVIALRSE